MAKTIKIYKPSEEEIIKNVLDSFEIEGMKISYDFGKEIFKKVLFNIYKRKSPL